MLTEKEREIQADPRIYNTTEEYPLSRLARMYRMDFAPFLDLVVRLRTEAIQNENRRMLTAFESIKRIASDLLDPVRRAGPRGGHTVNELWDMYQAGERGTGPVTHAEERP